MTIRLQVRELREARGWTQQALADRAGITRVTVNRLENRRVSAIDFTVLEKLAAAFGVSPGLLIVQDAPVEHGAPRKSPKRPRE